MISNGLMEAHFGSTRGIRFRAFQMIYELINDF
jgi:hypothetical protein